MDGLSCLVDAVLGDAGAGCGDDNKGGDDGGDVEVNEDTGGFRTGAGAIGGDMGGKPGDGGVDEDIDDRGDEESAVVIAFRYFLRLLFGSAITLSAAGPSPSIEEHES